jgi:hypothetical protein
MLRLALQLLVGAVLELGDGGEGPDLLDLDLLLLGQVTPESRSRTA